MAGRGRETFNKRQLERRRQEQQEAKRQRRQAAKDQIDGEVEEVDTDALYERFRLINEARSSGEIDDEEFAKQEQEILVALGVNVGD